MARTDSVRDLFEQAYAAVFECLILARSLDQLAIETVEVLLSPRRAGETDFSYQESLLGPVQMAEEQIPRLERAINCASRAVERIEDQLAVAIKAPAPVGRRSYVSYHRGVLIHAQGTLGEITSGIRKSSSSAPFVERWRAFCKRLSKYGDRLSDLPFDDLVAMLKIESIEARGVNPAGFQTNGVQGTKKGGRLPIWRDLWPLIAAADSESPMPSDEEIANRYNRRFTRRQHKASSKTVKSQRHAMKTKEGSASLS